MRVPALFVFAVFLRLGLTSFGGPIAHLGYFRRDLVERRRWLCEQEYADLVALCQFLPGPASSQAGFAIGLRKAGLAGGLAAFLGFTLPSAALMLAAAFGLAHAAGPWLDAVVHGLKLVAVSVVAHAVWSMARAHLKSLPAIAIALVALGLCLQGNSLTAPAVIGIAALIGAMIPFTVLAQPAETSLLRPRHPGRSVGLFATFLVLLTALPLLERVAPSPWLALTDGFYRAGALVFGGGHVVLPLLETATAGGVPHETFLSGYGLAQALPGPLFSFAAYAGALAGPDAPNLWAGLLAITMIFLPGFLLVAAADPLWSRLRREPRAVGAVSNASAAVVGVLTAALWTPVATSAIASPLDAIVALGGFAALLNPRIPVIVVVIAVALLGAFFGAIA